jgi:hypothetical protein
VKFKRSTWGPHTATRDGGMIPKEYCIYSFVVFVEKIFWMDFGTFNFSTKKKKKKKLSQQESLISKRKEVLLQEVGNFLTIFLPLGPNSMTLMDRESEIIHCWYELQAIFIGKIPNYSLFSGAILGPHIERLFYIQFFIPVSLIVHLSKSNFLKSKTMTIRREAEGGSSKNLLNDKSVESYIYENQEEAMLREEIEILVERNGRLFIVRTKAGKCL